MKEEDEFKVLIERAAKELAKATHLAGNITSESSWIEFDQVCHDAEGHICDALVLGVSTPPELEDRMWEVTALRRRVWENWEMKWREQEAIRDPKGRYGLMRARRLKLEADLARKS